MREWCFKALSLRPDSVVATATIPTFDNFGQLLIPILTLHRAMSLKKTRNTKVTLLVVPILYPSPKDPERK